MYQITLKNGNFIKDTIRTVFFSFVDNQKNAPKYRLIILSKRHRLVCNRAGNGRQLNGYKSEMTMVIGHRRTENIRFYQIGWAIIRHCLESMLFGKGKDVKQYSFSLAFFEILQDNIFE